MKNDGAHPTGVSAAAVGVNNGAHRPVLAVTFDMDGVLLDSEPLHRIVVNDLLAEHGVEVSSELYEHYLGTTLEYTWSDLIKRFELPGDIPSWSARYSDAIMESYRRHSVPSPGAIE